jgi:hypothetical protein
MCVSTLVDASVNVTLPKSASGSCSHVVKHAAGASTIHSALSVSGSPRIDTSLEKVAPVDTFVNATETSLLATVIDTCTLSPACKATGRSTDGAGKS